MKNAQLNNYCYNEVDWYQQIEKLILSKKKRKTIGIAGKVYVEKNYSNKRILDKWDIVYNKILKDLKKSNQV